jgi:hypothetical protein
MSLSAFFPFYRNHNTLSANPQEAYVWSSVAEASRRAMKIRYSLLPYIYTLFHQAHTTGSTVMRALAWEFPNDPSLASIDNQFLLGPAILVTPVLGQGLTSAKGVFPGVAKGQIWYDWYNQSAITARPGENVTLPAPLGHIPAAGSPVYHRRVPEQLLEPHRRAGRRRHRVGEGLHRRWRERRSERDAVCGSRGRGWCAVYFCQGPLSGFEFARECYGAGCEGRACQCQLQ